MLRSDVKLWHGTERCLQILLEYFFPSSFRPALQLDCMTKVSDCQETVRLQLDCMSKVPDCQETVRLQLDCMALEQPKKPVGGAFGQFLAEKRPEFAKAD